MRIVTPEMAKDVHEFNRTNGGQDPILIALVDNGTEPKSFDIKKGLIDIAARSVGQIVYVMQDKATLLNTRPELIPCDGRTLNAAEWLYLSAILPKTLLPGGGVDGEDIEVLQIPDLRGYFLRCYDERDTRSIMTTQPNAMQQITVNNTTAGGTVNSGGGSGGGYAGTVYDVLALWDNFRQPDPPMIVWSQQQYRGGLNTTGNVPVRPISFSTTVPFAAHTHSFTGTAHGHGLTNPNPISSEIRPANVNAMACIVAGVYFDGVLFK